MDAWLNAVQAAQYLGLPNKKALYEAIRRGTVPAYRLGKRRLRFRQDELDASMSKQGDMKSLFDAVASSAKRPPAQRKGG